jgi:hypothetical protein
MSNLVYKMELVTESAPSIAELDYFILSSGSDSRAYEVLSKAMSQVDSKLRVILLHFKERLEGKKPSDDLFKYKDFKITDLQEIFCEIKNPSSSLEDFKKNDFNDSIKIGVDISCFTKPYFYYLIKLLKERFKVSRITIYYTEPKSYLFPKGLFNTFHTSTGPLSIVEIPGYSGQEARDSKRKLIILLGFDGDLSKEINEDVSPNETVVVNGFPSYTPKFKDISLIANEKLVSDHNIEVQYARANNPFEVYNLLESIKNKDSGATFINIAPLGTKPMALGACLFALHNPEVRIVYPLPEKYEDKYSDACWNSWMYELPLTI